MGGSATHREDCAKKRGALVGAMLSLALDWEACKGEQRGTEGGLEKGL